MSSRFVVKTKFSMAHARALAQESVKKYLIRQGICGAVVIACGILDWAIGFRDFAGLCWGIALLLLLLSAWRLTRVPKRVFKSVNPSHGEIEQVFDEAGVSATSDLETGTVQYASYVRLVEQGDFFLLYKAEKAAVVLAKADFVEGDPAEFMPFMERKTGLKAEHRRAWYGK